MVEWAAADREKAQLLLTATQLSGPWIAGSHGAGRLATGDWRLATGLSRQGLRLHTLLSQASLIGDWVVPQVPVSISRQWPGDNW